MPPAAGSMSATEWSSESRGCEIRFRADRRVYRLRETNILCDCTTPMLCTAPCAMSFGPRCGLAASMAACSRTIWAWRVKASNSALLRYCS
jgi:hypothetical protein